MPSGVAGHLDGYRGERQAGMYGDIVGSEARGPRSAKSILEYIRV